jgi:DNA-binding response OmpR family regulator
MQPTVQIKRTILVIDDDIDVLKLHTRALGAAYSVVTKGDGAEALKWLQAGNIPDMILSDVLMPNMDGLEFLKVVHNSRSLRQIPVVIISVNNEVRTRIKFLQMGADDYIIKPVHPEELVLRIHNIFKRMTRPSEVV